MKKLLCLLALLILKSSYAASVMIGPVVPSAWRIENYAPGGAVVVWYSGSTCTNGQIMLPSNATTQDHSRLYATVMAAKAGNLKVFIVYDNAQSGCPISSFGIQ